MSIVFSYLFLTSSLRSIALAAPFLRGTLSAFFSLKLTFCTDRQLGICRGVLAGLFNLSAAFETVGESAPTALLTLVQDVS
ncbi:MAG: hypothetical protein MUE44_17555 [Oscillatoriaceae cyanobacterium Prado104]|jgi:hypothetical protein|nr:hypothetical protein [Oscillatoriaceae cyanobacterium Prado104]